MHVCLILFPGFPILGYVLIQEVLRLANASAVASLFTCRIRTVTGQPTMAGDGTEIRADAQDWEGAQGFDLVVLCAGPGPLDHLPMGLRGFLTRAANAGATLAGLDQGALILAKLGFLEGREAVLPVDIAPDAKADFPNIALSDRSHVFDRARLTSSGGLATAEALLDWVARVRGAKEAAQVSEALALGRLKTSADKLHISHRLTASEDPVINQMQAIMAAHMDAPLPLPRIAAELDLNPRQLRHRCQQATGTTPTQVYTTLRLTRARKLTQDTALSVAEIAKATGFTSPSSFTRAYRDHFGQAPRFERAEKTAKHAARTKHAVKTKKAPDKAPQSEKVMSWSEAEDAARPTAPAPSEDRKLRAT